MTTETHIHELKPMDRETEALLRQLHALLIAHRYDYAQGEQLDILSSVIPEAEEYYEADDPALRPPVIGIVQALQELAIHEVQEALYLGYLIGQVENGNPDCDLPLDERARQTIAKLGLEELMEFNLSFGYVPTEKATAAPKDPVAQ